MPLALAVGSAWLTNGFANWLIEVPGGLALASKWRSEAACGRGETGRRARFRSWSRKGWRFDSSRPHEPTNTGKEREGPRRPGRELSQLQPRPSLLGPGCYALGMPGEEARAADVPPWEPRQAGGGARWRGANDASLRPSGYEPAQPGTGHLPALKHPQGTVSPLPCPPGQLDQQAPIARCLSVTEAQRRPGGTRGGAPRRPKHPGLALAAEPV
jgi:hypothetical protein